MLFTLHDITKTYGKITALRGLSVAVPPGAVGLLGPNGAGKTTMIRALLGLISIDSGSGEVLGLNLRSRRLDIRQAIGFVPEDECLFPGVAGVDFVAYAGELCGMSRTNALQRAHEVLNHVELGEARYRPVESYSAGMKQRVKLASALVHDPTLLILDEPTNGMDPTGRTEMLELARDLAHGKQMSLLFSSHLLPDEEQTLTYLLLRPLPRWALYLVKLLATWLMISALTAVFAAATFAAIALTAHEPITSRLIMQALKTAVAMALAQAGYCGLFGLMGLLMRRSLFVGVAYIFLFEGILASLDTVARRMTIMYYFRVLVLRWLEPAHGTEWSINLVTAPYARTCVLTLLGAGLVLAAAAAFFFAGREFRMKTPEGN
jgi:ABC-type Na+ transport system ATPase subunit NatA